MWLIIVLVIGVCAIIMCKNNSNSYWIKRNVSPLKSWPIFGHVGPLIFKTRSFAALLEDMYNAHPTKRYVGLHNFQQPTLLVRDPELIKQITVKHFEAFSERQPFIPKGVDLLWDRTLFGMQGEEKWRNMRTIVSPTFTSSKMKMMFGSMKGCVQQLIRFLDEKDIAAVEVKGAFSRLSSDVIATTMFGVQCNSLRDLNNKFYTTSKKIMDFNGIRGLIVLLCTVSPPLLLKLLNINIIPEKVKVLYTYLINETLKIREQQKAAPPDMIHLLIEAKKGTLRRDDHVIDSGFAIIKDTKIERRDRRSRIKVTDEDIVAQAIIFFAAGFDTTSTFMSYLCYEVAIHSDIQQQLKNEIEDSLIVHDGKVTYEALLEMEYLDMVISEALRKWPPAEVINRRCIKEITIEPTLPNEQPLKLDANVNCWIPVYPIHRDPKNYPNPDKFDPERFSSRNRSCIKPFTFLPFGAGPRSCVGIRFALLEAKLTLVEILSKFDIVTVADTQIPLQLRKGAFAMIPERGIWLGFRNRRKYS